MKTKLKVGDEVIVNTGKYKGQRGTIERFLLTKGRVVVNGINLIKKHVKADPNRQREGGIISKEAPIHLSNVAIINPKTNKADKISLTTKDDKKIRVFRSNQEPVEA